MKRHRSKIKNDEWARTRQRWRANSMAEEIVRVANENEVYTIPFQFNTPSLETIKNLDKEPFRSKHFIRATNICVVCSVLIFIILICMWMWIYFETSCHGVG